MHELGIASSMVETLLDLMKSEKLTSIKSVTLTIGEATGIVPRFMQECWPAVIEETALAGCELKINFIASRGRCRNCENEFLIAPFKGICPKCGSSDYDVVNGYEFEITEIIGK